MLDGSIERYKVNLVVKDYRQMGDYWKTFALTAKMNTVKILLSLTVILIGTYKQFDVKNIFLNRDYTRRSIRLCHLVLKARRGWYIH